MKIKSSKSISLPVIPWEDCFAKSVPGSEGPLISVAEHCRTVGCLTDEIQALLPHQVRGCLPICAGTLAKLHDVGKVSPGFLLHCSARKVKSLSPGLGAISIESRGLETRHARIGEAAVRCWAEKSATIARPDSDWYRIIGAHHGRRESFSLRAEAEIYGGKVWQDEREKLIEDLLGTEDLVLTSNEPTPAQLKVMAGLTSVADWIGSDERFFPPTGLPIPGELYARASNALIQCGWQSLPVQPGLDFGDIFPGWEPSTVQKIFVDAVTGPGLYILEAPMGSGKTEAALFAAYRLMVSGINRGLYFALPTRLTSNRIHKRLEEFLKAITRPPLYSAEPLSPGVRLAHGDAWLEGGGEEMGIGGGWFLPSRRALLYPFGVGTVDQALLSLLGVKFNFVRTFGLAGKVVIIDEVHSYDEYTGTLIKMLVKELLEIGCTVFILSATLTVALRCLLLGDSTPDSIEYPLISYNKLGESFLEKAKVGLVSPDESPEKPSIDIRVRLLEFAPGDLVEEVVRRAADGQCVLWIENTVASAQEVYRTICSEMREGEFPVGLLHSRFPRFRRKELEDDWMEALGKDGDRPEGCVLVATQVVEQSVDIDADFMITALAPVDLVLQRLGRLWRHNRPDRPAPFPEVLVRIPPGLEDSGSAEDCRKALGVNGYVYHPCTLYRSFCILKEKKTIHLPEDIRSLLEASCKDSEESPGWMAELTRQYREDCRKLQGIAEGVTAIDGFSDNEDTAPTRWSDRPTAKILLLNSYDTDGRRVRIDLADGSALAFNVGERRVDIARALYRNIVPVPWKRWMAQTGVHEGEKWLKPLIFGSVFPFKRDGDQLFNLLGEKIDICYNEKVGVYFSSRPSIKEDFNEFMW